VLFPPHPLRAALYRAAELVPGAQVLSEVTDPAGHPGRAVAMVDDDGIQRQLIFDPETAAPRGERRVVIRRTDRFDFAPGTVVAEVLYLASGVASTTATIAGSR
jgi:hypothetical protein